MNTPARFPVLSLWLLLLLPVNALVVLDLWAGVVRPLTWAARLFPALVVLGLVAFAVTGAGAVAVRLKKELRLALGPGLLLLIPAGAGWCADAVAPGVARDALAALPVGLSLLVPASVVLLPMFAERQAGALGPLLVSPRGGRAFAEKFALGALLVVLSWLQQSVLMEHGTPAWWFALATHGLAVLTPATWFFLVERDETAFGLTVGAPLLLSALPLVFFPQSVLPVLAVYGAAMVGLVPFVVRRGVASSSPDWARREPPGLARLERWLGPIWGAHLRSQRDVALLSLVAVVGWSLLRLAGEGDAAAPLLFFFAAFAAVLSPALAFAGARKQGTLEAQLAAQSRASVFRQRALVSALSALTFAALVPGAVLAFEGATSGPGVASWLLAVAVCWAVGLAASVHFGSVEVALAAGLGLTVAVVGLEGGLFGSAAWATARVLAPRDWPHVGAYLFATLGVAGIAALVVAWRRFVRSDRLEPGVLAGAFGFSLLHAAVLGGASVVAVSLGL